VRSIDSIVIDNVRQERLVAQLSTSFGALALVLVCVGLSGIVSYTVVRRTREIGVRMALGAEPAAVMRLIVGETAVPLGIGLALGVAAGLVIGRLLQSQMFGLTPTDPLTFVAAIGAMTVVSVIAAYAPARRASSIEPVVALRND